MFIREALVGMETKKKKKTHRPCKETEGHRREIRGRGDIQRGREGELGGGAERKGN